MGGQHRILVVDDERAVLMLMCRHLRNEGYQTVEANDAETALKRMDADRFDLVITDVRMPVMDGIALLEAAKKRDPLIPVILVTSVIDIETAVRAMRLGADDYILKPFRLDAVNEAVEHALEQHRQRVTSRRYQEELEGAVAEKTLEIRETLSHMHEAFDATVEAMVSAIEARDVETQHHCRRAREYTVMLGEVMGLPSEELRDLGWGGLLHDVGKIGVRDGILLKRGPLTAEEWTEMKKHPVIGYRLLHPIDFLRPAAEVVLHHHERWDGRGYPFGKRAQEVPFGARIFGIADAFETITSRRVYKSAVSIEEARREIQAGSGSQFDPDVVSAFLSIPVQKWQVVRESYRGDRTAVELPAFVH